MVIRNLPRLACVFAIVLALTGCGGGGGGGGGAPSGGKQLNITQDCSQLQWTSTSADPMSTVLVKGVDKKLRRMLTDPGTDAYARIEANGKTLGAMPVRWLSAYATPSLEVGVPAAPENPYQGGKVEVTLVFGQSECPSQTLTVSALKVPAKPNQVIGNSVNELQSLLMKRARTYGYQSFSDLIAKRDRIRNQGDRFTVPEAILVMAADGLEKLKQKTGSGKLNADAAKFMAAVLQNAGQKGFVGGLQDLSSVWGGNLPSVNPDQDLQPATVINPDNGNFVRATSTSSGGAGACAGVLMGKPEPIGSASELSTYMIQQHDAYAKVNGKSGTAIDLIGLGLPVAGLVSGPGEAVAVAVSLEIYVYQFVQALTINTFPSQFDRVDLRLDPGATFPEDYMEVSTNSTPRWVEADATVSSKGMNLSGKAIGAALQVFGMTDFGVGRGVEQEFAEDVRDALQGMNLYNSQKLLNSLLSQVGGGADCLRIEPWTWSGIDISSGTYSTANYYGSNIQLQSAPGDPNKQTMKPVQTGTGALAVDAKDVMFGGHQGSALREIEVEKIELVPDPNPYWVNKPGETKTFKIHIAPADAANPGKALTDRIIAGGGHAYPPAYNASGAYHTVKVDTPTDTSKYPVKVRVTRTASIPDEQGRKIRTAVIEIRNDQAVDLTPDKRCLSRGETLQLSAEVHGLAALKSGDLTWTVTSGGGSVQAGSVNGTTQTGTYTAPQGATDARVRAAYTDSQGKTVSDTSHIPVGSCDANVYVGGHYEGSADAGQDHYGDRSQLPLLPVDGKPIDPSLKWVGKTVQYDSGGTAQGTVRTECQSTSSDPSSPTGEVCGSWQHQTVRAYQGGQGTVTVDADGDATFTLDHTGKVRCYGTDDRYDRYRKVNCSYSSASDGWRIRYYFDIDSATKPKRKVTVTLRCQEQNYDLGLVVANMHAARWKPGAGPTKVTPIDISTTHDQYMQDLANGTIDRSQHPTRWALTKNTASACGSGQTVKISKTLDTPPPDPAAAPRHQGVIELKVGAVAEVAPTYSKEELRKALRQTLAYPPTVVQPPGRVPGTWSGSVTVNGHISVKAIR